MTWLITFSRPWLVVLALGAILITGLGLGALYLPQASITLALATEKREIEQPITLKAEAEPDFRAFRLPAQIVTVEINKEQEFTRGQEKLEQGLAQGSVVLINKLNEEQQLLPKTHLRHEASGTFFLTDTPVAIPAGGEKLVTVTAKEEGEAGNVEAGRFIVDKLSVSTQAQVYGESKAPFTGGLIVEQPLSEQEIEDAKTKVRAAAEEEVRGSLTAAAGGAPLRPDLITLTTEEENISAAAGSKAYSFSVRLRIKARALVVEEANVLSLAVLALRTQAGEGKTELVRYEPESFTIKLVRLNWEKEEAQVTAKLTGIFMPKLPPLLLQGDNLAGLSRAEAETQLTKFAEVERAEIKLSPWWVKRMPARMGAIDIQVAEIE
jgi:hypothetical protein